jgi:hypothetical protein
VGSYNTYREASDAVEHLKNLKVPKQWYSIVPKDIVLVETEGGMNRGRAALIGAAAGGIFGLFLAIFSGLFSWGDPAIADLWAAAIAVGMGVVFGAAIGLLAYAAGQDAGSLQKGERWEAGRYDVVTDEANAEEARRTLQAKVGVRA